MDKDEQKIEAWLHRHTYLNSHKMISLPTANGCEFYPLSDIIRCEGDNNYTIFHVVGAKKLVISKTLGEYEVMFRGYNFFRVHQSHLINLLHVKSYSKSKGIITLTDNSQVEISRRKKLEFFKLFSF